MFSLCASGVGGWGLEGRNAITAVARGGGHKQGKLSSGILLGDLYLVFQMCKLGLLVGVSIAMMIEIGESFV